MGVGMFYRVRFVIMFILHLYQYIFKFQLPQKNTSLFMLCPSTLNQTT